MTILDAWPHKWFGFWREHGAAYRNCPSIHDFVFPEIVASYDKKRLREYLMGAYVVVATSRIGFPSPFTGKTTGGSICCRTDGEWTWFDDLPDYIELHHVALPTAFLERIKSYGYLPPEVDPAVVPSLERHP